MRRNSQTEPLYTVEAYFGLLERGLLSEDDRVELLNGVVVSMSPQSPRHAAVISILQHLPEQRLPTTMHVRCQMDLVLNDKQVPEPDLAVVDRTPSDYVAQHPTTARLVIEVADSSLPQDRLTKARLYAARGIGEYWIVNLRRGEVEVFPRPERGTYRQITTYTAAESLASSVLSYSIRVSEILPAGPTTDAG